MMVKAVNTKFSLESYKQTKGVFVCQYTRDGETCEEAVVSMDEIADFAGADNRGMIEIVHNAGMDNESTQVVSMDYWLSRADMPAVLTDILK